LVDDDREWCVLTAKRLEKLGFDVHEVFDSSEAFAVLTDKPFDAVVSDVKLLGMNGIELTKRIVELRPNTPVIIVTSFGTMELAIEAIRAGAFDFITKPFDLDPFVIALNRAVAYSRLRREVKMLRSAVQDTSRFEDLIGKARR
jgi:two-component system response regulator HydG